MSFLQDIVSLCRSRQTLTKTRQAVRSLRKFEMRPRYPQRPRELIGELRGAGCKQERFWAGSKVTCSKCQVLLSVRTTSRDAGPLRAQEQRHGGRPAPRGAERSGRGARGWRRRPQTTCSVRREDVTRLQGDGWLEVGKTA